MKKILLCLFAIILTIQGNIFAQQNINANTYRFNAANSSPVGITPTQLIGPNSDQVASTVTAIGFTFWFAGTPYTQFSVNENGLMTLGSTRISGNESTNLMASGTTNPKIAPYWDDLATGTTGSVGYQLTGTAPNRILYVNWNVTVPKNPTGAPNATFQVQLYETGNIFFAFGATLANTGQYSMGIGLSSTDFASVTVAATQTSSTCAYGTANNTNTLAAGSGKRYQFSIDNTAPTITAATIPNTAGTANRTLSTTIADQAGSVVTGIPTTGGFVPRIYYKKNSVGSWVSTAGILTSGSGTTGTWTFTVDHSLLGGVAAGDQIYYYLIAQDQADYKGFPNISSIPAGVVASNVNTIINPPANIPYYIIGGSLSGTKTVGLGGDFESLTLAGGLFDQLNAGELSGNLTINIISDLTSETGLKGLNAWVNGTGGPFTVTIHPVGQRIISGATINGGTANLLSLNGVNGLTLDGLNDGTNSLTLIQTGQYLVGSVIDLKAASNNTVTRVTIKGYGASNSAISITNTTLPASNNVISYCNITTNLTIPNTFNAGQGISLLVTTSTGGDHNIIDNNTITNFVYNGIVVSGRFINTVISNNEIYNTVGTSWNNNFRGINVGSPAGTTNIFNNKIHDLLLQTNTASSGIPAILTNAGSGTISNIYNNVIYLDASFTHPQQTWYGIQTQGAGAVNIYYNSIYIGGTDITAVTTYGSYGIKKEGTGITNIKNNAVFNARSNSTGTGKHYGIYITGTVTSNNNDIFVNGTGGVFGNSSATDRLNLSSWQTATSQDANSLSVDPMFTSSTDLLPQTGSVVAGAATPVSGITTDIRGTTRNTIYPSIGAYDLEYVVQQIENNTIDFIGGLKGSRCATAAPDMNAVLTAPAGTVFTKVDFASYGNPTGSCPNFIIGSCNALTSQSIVEGYLLGKNSATIPASNSIFGDPCPGTFKSLYISATYAEPLCAGSLPGAITGSIPTGGNANYTYLWESSTTSAVDGFSPASGTNNTQNYQPAALSQNTWFRRTVTSGVVNNTTPALQLNVTPTLPVSVAIAASATVVNSGETVTFTATPTNGGTLPVYQWKVNNNNAGTNNAIFSYAPLNNDVITCVMTSNASCASGPATSNTVTMTVSSTILNNNIDYLNGLTGTICATASSDLNAVLTAPAGTVFVKVDFASYGNPTGSCPDFIPGSCNSLTSQSIVEGYLLGNNTATIPATNAIFGDPCPGTYKSLYVKATYAQPLCAGSLPGVITGSTPTGGDGSYAYLWEASTTSAGSGFSPATGTNNTQNYTPGTLAQTTWFRRTVTSGSFSNTTPALLLNVTPALPVSIAISASATQVNSGETVTFTATPTNGGTLPVYQWKVNNINAGTNSTIFTYTPQNNDVVTCELTSDAVCPSGNPAVSNPVTISVASDILNNTIDNLNGVHGTVCATASSDLNAVLTAPAGTVFVKVDFASYGNPTGSCPDFIPGSCNSLTSQSITEGYLLGNNTATIPATNAIFGDPCPGTYKSLYVKATYAEPLCAGSLPGVINGSIPTGGDGSYAYIWEASTTSAGSGFSPATGTNNTQNYTPGTLAQTTWFRRTVTSGSYSNTTPALLLNVTPALPVSIAISASATQVNSGETVTFTATPTNGGTLPVYQWKVNNINAGTNSTIFTYTPLNNDVVACELTSDAVCPSGNPAVSNPVTISVASDILNNTIDNLNGVHGTVCATASSDLNAVLTAPAGAVFVKVDFASYGNPTGSCPDFILGSCNSLTSQSITEGYLLGNNTATIPATNAIFGDPCPGTYKSLYIKAAYAEPVCSGSLPGPITGSTPLGGNGIYTYLWESSTTSSTSGFAAASGNNSTKDYTPELLTQTTWFRRTITSGSFTSVSTVMEINITNCGVIPPAGFQAKGFNNTAAISGSNSALNTQSSVKSSEIRDTFIESLIEIYPVPSNGHFTVAITTKEEKNFDIQVFNANGAKILEKRDVIVNNRTEIIFDLESSPAGVYYLKFTNGNFLDIKKIILSR